MYINYSENLKSSRVFKTFFKYSMKTWPIKYWRKTSKCGALLVKKKLNNLPKLLKAAKLEVLMNDLKVQSAQIPKRLHRCLFTWKRRKSMRLSSYIEALNMDGNTKTFIKELTIRTGQYHSSRLKMETALVVSPHSHGITGEIGLTASSATTTRFSSISPAPANSPPNTLEKIYTAIHVWVLHLKEVEMGGN